MKWFYHFKCNIKQSKWILLGIAMDTNSSVPVSHISKNSYVGGSWAAVWMKLAF